MLFSKVGLIIGIIAAVVGVLTYLWKTNEGFRNAVGKIWEKIKAVILSAVERIKAWWEKNGEKVINAVVKALQTVWKVVSTVFKKIWSIASKIWGTVKDIVIDAVKAIQRFWEKNGAKIWATVKKIFTAIWECIKAAYANIGDALAKFFSYVKPIWEKLKTLFVCFKFDRYR